MKYFPTIIVDNFLKDALIIRDYAKTLEYSYPEDFGYPGLRTQCLSTINYELYNYIGNLILSCYGIREDFTYKAMANFQIIDNNYFKGWIHSDPPLILTSIIYLSDNLNSGTSIYKNSTFWTINENREIEKNFYKKLAENKKYKINKSEIEALEQRNKPFHETVNVKALFNRMLSYESSEYHGANNLDGFDQENVRLTLVYGFSEINLKRNSYPLFDI